MRNGKTVGIGVLGLMLFLAAADAQEPRRNESRADVPKSNAGTKKDSTPREMKTREDSKAAATAALA